MVCVFKKKGEGEENNVPIVSVLLADLNIPKPREDEILLILPVCKPSSSSTFANKLIPENLLFIVSPPAANKFCCDDWVIESGKGSWTKSDSCLKNSAIVTGFVVVVGLLGKRIVLEEGTVKVASWELNRPFPVLLRINSLLSVSVGSSED